MAPPTYIASSGMVYNATSPADPGLHTVGLLALLSAALLGVLIVRAVRGRSEPLVMTIGAASMMLLVVGVVNWSEAMW